MRRFVSNLALGAAMAVVLAGCSQPEYYEMRPHTLTFESKGATRSIRAVAMDRRGNEYPTQKPTRWESSDESVATVDGEGKVTAVASGIATIKAIRGDLSGEVMVDVNTVEKLVVEPAEVRIQQDGDPFLPTIKLLDGRGRPLTDRTVQARCADEKICTADGQKKIWGHDPGETTYLLQHDDLEARVKVVVEPAKRR